MTVRIDGPTPRSGAARDSLHEHLTGSEPIREPRPPTPVAPTIGRYRVIDEIGAGAMGAVVRAHDERLGRDVAIKRIKNVHGLLAAVFHARFEAEARALAALSHPGVVQVFDLGIDGDDPYLVMELLEGPSLKDERVRRGTLPAAEVVSIGIQLARALAAAHARGILHRDVKPGNVVRGRDGLWKLVDFGVAHLPDSDVTLSGQFLGTPAYAAPEALTQGRFSAASDVYGLAATLHEIATGSKPRGDLTIAELFKRSDQPVLDDAARAALGSLGPALAAGLALDPAARPDAAGFAELLAQTGPGAAAAASDASAVAAAAAGAATPVVAATPAPASLATATAALPDLPPRRDRRWRGLLAGTIVVVVIGLLALADRLGGSSGPAVGVGAPPGLRGSRAPAPGPLRFAAPADLDERGARDWMKIADKIHDGDQREALDKLRGFERKHGASPESARLRAWLEAQPDGHDRE